MQSKTAEYWKNYPHQDYLNYRTADENSAGSADFGNFFPQNTAAPQHRNDGTESADAGNENMNPLFEAEKQNPPAEPYLSAPADSPFNHFAQSPQFSSHVPPYTNPSASGYQYQEPLMNTENYYVSPINTNPQNSNPSPHVSGRFVLIALAIIFAAAALTLAFMPKSYGSWAVTAGVISGALGVAVAIAGAQGKRATWLTFCTWIAAFPTICAIFLALFLPNKVVMSEHTQFLTSQYSGITFNADEDESVSLIERSTREITAKYPQKNLTISAGIASNIDFKVPDDQAVIFKITGRGAVTINPLKEWKVIHHGEITMTIPPEVIIDDTQGIEYLNQNSQFFNLRNGEEITLFSPAAQTNPNKSRIIEIDFGFGNVAIGAKSPKDTDRVEYVTKVLKVTPITPDGKLASSSDAKVSNGNDTAESNNSNVPNPPAAPLPPETNEK
ncbi:hypothetical protein RQN30_03590 [Arcanobacterium hippocoleae]